MEISNFNHNNTELFQAIVSDSLKYQEKARDLEQKLKKANIENGKLIMQNSNLNKQITSLTDTVEILKTEIEKNKVNTEYFLKIIEDMQSEICKLSKMCIDTIEKNKMLIETNRIMLRQHSDFYDLKNKLLNENLELKLTLQTYGIIV
jgi:hypothetical protein